MPGYQLIVIKKGRKIEMRPESMWTQEGALDRAKTLIRSGKIDPRRETVYWIKAFSVGNGPVEVELGEFTHEDLGIVKRRVGRPSKEGVDGSEDRVKCPSCGIKTIPDREGLTEEEMLCESCYKLLEEGKS